MKAVLLMVRGLSAGYVGCYGNEWLATPTLDRLAAEGVVFDQHFVDRPDPMGADYAFRTGRYSFPVPDDSTETPDQGLREAFLLFQERGISTLLISDKRAPTTESGWQYIHQAQRNLDK